MLWHYSSKLVFEKFLFLAFSEANSLFFVRPKPIFELNRTAVRSDDISIPAN